MAWPIMVVEVQPYSGADTNGGRFDPAIAGGVDLSVSAPLNFDGSTLYLTAAGAQTTAVVVGTTPLASWVGNCIYVTGGANATPGRYRITVVSSQTLTLVPVAGSGNWCTGAVTNGAGNLGGAFQTISAVITDTYIGSSKIFVKAEVLAMPIQTAAGFTFSVSVTPQYNAPQTRIIGYTSVRGDGGKPTIQLITNVSLTAITVSGQGTSVENFILDCNSLTGSTGLAITGLYSQAFNIKAQNFAVRGVLINATYCQVALIEATGGTSTATCGIAAAQSWDCIYQSYVHDNLCVGIQNTAYPPQVNLWCILDNNSGAVSDGIQSTNWGNLIVQNIVSRSGRHGIYLASTNSIINLFCKANIVANAGRSTGTNAASAYGLAGGSNPGQCASWFGDGNAYYNNLSGTRLNMDDAGTVNKINGIAPYTNVLDVYSANALFDANFNPTSYAQTNGQPSTWPGLPLTVGHPDFGAVQSRQAIIVNQTINRFIVPEGEDPNAT